MKAIKMSSAKLAEVEALKQTAEESALRARDAHDRAFSFLYAMDVLRQQDQRMDTAVYEAAISMLRKAHEQSECDAANLSRNYRLDKFLLDNTITKRNSNLRIHARRNDPNGKVIATVVTAPPRDASYSPGFTARELYTAEYDEAVAFADSWEAGVVWA